MKTLVAVLVVVAGCMDSSENEQPVGGGGDAAVLPSDAHFVEVFRPYKTPEECIANTDFPYSCEFSLSLCSNGRAGYRIGDIVDDGTYAMDGSIAYIHLRNSEMRFDVDAVVEIGGGPNGYWIVDTERRWETLQFDNIDCSRP